MTTSEIIKRCRKAFFQMRNMEENVKSRAKLEGERGAAEVVLIMDDLRQEGINPLSPLGLTCVTEIWKEKQRQIAREIGKGADDRDAFTSGSL